MRLPNFEFAEPDSLKQACAVLDEHGEDAWMLGGGTDITINIKHRVIEPKLVVDVKNLAELQYIRDTDAGVEIGSSTTLFEMQQSALIAERYPVLWTAAHFVGAEHHQMMGTIAGNLCQNTRCRFYNQTQFWRKARPLCYKARGDMCYIANQEQVCYATYHGDTAPALFCYEAKLKIAAANGRQRSIGIEELFSKDGNSPSTLEHGEVIAEVLLPQTYAATNGWRGSYKKLRQRDSIDFPLLGVSTIVRLAEDGRTCSDVRMAMTALITHPVRALKVEEALRGKTLNPEVIAQAAKLAAKADRFVQTGFVSTKYKKTMIEVFVREALEEIASGQITDRPQITTAG